MMAVCVAVYAAVLRGMDTEEPWAEEPDTEEPWAEEPDTEEPWAEEPDTEEPWAEEPDTEEPDLDDLKAYMEENVSIGIEGHTMV
jgi:hypothetical protein